MMKTLRSILLILTIESIQILSIYSLSATTPSSLRLSTACSDLRSITSIPSINSISSSNHDQFSSHVNTCGCGRDERSKLYSERHDYYQGAAGTWSRPTNTRSARSTYPSSSTILRYQRRSQQSLGGVVNTRTNPPQSRLFSTVVLSKFWSSPISSTILSNNIGSSATSSSSRRLHQQPRRKRGFHKSISVSTSSSNSKLACYRNHYSYTPGHIINSITTNNSSPSSSKTKTNNGPPYTPTPPTTLPPFLQSSATSSTAISTATCTTSISSSSADVVLSSYRRRTSFRIRLSSLRHNLGRIVMIPFLILKIRQGIKKDTISSTASSTASSTDASTSTTKNISTNDVSTRETDLNLKRSPQTLSGKSNTISAITYKTTKTTSTTSSSSSSNDIPTEELPSFLQSSTLSTPEMQLIGTTMDLPTTHSFQDSDNDGDQNDPDLSTARKVKIGSANVQWARNILQQSKERKERSNLNDDGAATSIDNGSGGSIFDNQDVDPMAKARADTQKILDMIPTYYPVRYEGAGSTTTSTTIQTEGDTMKLDTTCLDVPSSDDSKSITTTPSSSSSSTSSEEEEGEVKKATWDDLSPYLSQECIQAVTQTNEKEDLTPTHHNNTYSPIDSIKFLQESSSDDPSTTTSTTTSSSTSKKDDDDRNKYGAVSEDEQKQALNKFSPYLSRHSIEMLQNLNEDVEEEIGIVQENTELRIDDFGVDNCIHQTSEDMEGVVVEDLQFTSDLDLTLPEEKRGEIFELLNDTITSDSEELKSDFVDIDDTIDRGLENMEEDLLRASYLDETMAHEKKDLQDEINVSSSLQLQNEDLMEEDSSSVTVNDDDVNDVALDNDELLSLDFMKMDESIYQKANDLEEFVLENLHHPSSLDGTLSDEKEVELDEMAHQTQSSDEQINEIQTMEHSAMSTSPTLTQQDEIIINEDSNSLADDGSETEKAWDTNSPFFFVNVTTDENGPFVESAVATNTSTVMASTTFGNNMHIPAVDRAIGYYHPPHPASTLEVFQDSDGLFYDTTLDFCNTKRSKTLGSQKYYRMQLLKSKTTTSKHLQYVVWFKYGQIGNEASGQSLKGPYLSSAKAISVFRRRYREKTGNNFNVETFETKVGKYKPLDVAIATAEEGTCASDKSQLDNEISLPRRRKLKLSEDDSRFLENLEKMSFEMDALLLPILSKEESSKERKQSIPLQSEHKRRRRHRSKSISLQDSVSDMVLKLFKEISKFYKRNDSS